MDKLKITTNGSKRTIEGEHTYRVEDSNTVKQNIEKLSIKFDNS